MPKSRRAKIVHLNKTQKKGSTLKTTLVDTLREALDEYSSAYVIECNDIRSNHFKEIRAAWTDSKLLMGKNKVMKVALGRSPEEEFREGLYKLGEDLTGNTGLLLTNRDKSEVEKYFNAFVVRDYPRTKYPASYEVKLEAGPLEHFPASQTEHLRQLGLPVQLRDGVIHLLEDYVVCKKGDILKPEQAKLLSHFGHEMAEYRITLRSYWHDGKYEKLNDMSED